MEVLGVGNVTKSALKKEKEKEMKATLINTCYTALIPN
jgi:hypothetical protein